MLDISGVSPYRGILLPPQTMPLRLHEFFQQVPTDVTIYQSADPSLLQREWDGTFRAWSWNINQWGHVSATPATLTGWEGPVRSLSELASFIGANDGKLPKWLLQEYEMLRLMGVPHKFLGVPLIETCFNWRDVERAQDVAHLIRTTPEQEAPDVVCLQEVFDPYIANHILWPVLRERYPYAVCSGSGTGIPGILLQLALRHPHLIHLMEARDVSVQKLINGLLGGYYTDAPKSFLEEFRGAMKEMLFPTRRVMPWTSMLFEDPFFWGAGIMILSRYPIKNFQYKSHPYRTDFEVYTDKGCLWADIEFPSEQSVRFMGSHMNDGERPHNEEVRRIQASRLALRMAQSPHPSLLMVDTNTTPATRVDGDRRAYNFLTAHNIRDAYLDTPSPTDSGKAISFEQRNHFAFLKGSDKATTETGEGRIDYHFVMGRDIQPLQLEYIDKRYGVEGCGQNPFNFWRTDHWLLKGTYQLKES